MSEHAPAVAGVPFAAKVVFILLAGALSMSFAEVLAGSSVLWFVTPWAWLVTFWLYLAHILLFINLALIFKRTSLTSLYLWGVLFGLYESWITKVAWAGYAGHAPGIGRFLGFAIPEFPLIVFFWHPVLAFILPVLAFEALSGKDRILPMHRRLLAKTPLHWLLALMVIVIGSTCLSMNANVNILATVVTIVGSAAIVGVLYFIASKYFGEQFRIESLRLGKTGMAILIVYLALLYSLAFIFLFPDRIAPPFTIALTLGVYAVIALLLYLKKPDAPDASAPAPAEGFFSRNELAALVAIITLVAALLCLLAPVDSLLVLIVYVIIFLVSPVLFLLAVYSVATGAIRKKTINA